MKAPVFKGIGQPLAIETLPDPTPGPGELVLKVGHCGICGTDLHKTSSHDNPYAIGTVIGHEFSGEVVAIGEGESRYRMGDHVAAIPLIGCGNCASCQLGEPRWCAKGIRIWYGGAGQYALAKETSSIKLPASLSVEDGALVEPMAVARHGLSLAAMKPGTNVLVQGSGPIGLAAAFWAKALGAGRIVMSSRSARREDLALQFGAEQFLTFDEDFPSKVMGAFDGHLPELVLECVGQPGLLAQAIAVVRERGTIILLGNCMAADTVVPSQAVFKEVRIQGSMGYSIGDFENSARKFDDGHIHPAAMVTGHLNYHELPAGFEALRTPGRECKVLIDPWN